MRRAAIAVLACGLVALLAGIGVAFTAAGYRTIDSNRVGKDRFVAEIPPDSRACQVGETVPAGTGRIRLTLADRDLPTPPVDFVFLGEDGATVAQAELRAGWEQGVVTVPLARDVRRAAGGVTWCVANRGRVTVLVAGQPGGDPTFNASVGMALTDGRMRVDYLTRDKASWWSQVGVVADRFGLGKGRHFSGSWPLWVALVAVLASWVLLARVVVRMATAPEGDA